MSGQSPMHIRASDVVKSRGGRLVLRNVELTMNAARVVLLTGANGAGKTTLLRCLAGRARPTSGQIKYFDRWSRATVAVRRRIGWLADQCGLCDQLTVRENLRFAARIYGVPQAVHVVARWIDESGLTASADRLAGQLSQGTRRRVALVRALQHGPRIVLLDEPLAHVDEAWIDWVLSRLQRLSSDGCSVLIATHRPDVYSASVDRIVHLKRGRLCDLDRASESRFRAERRSA